MLKLIRKPVKGISSRTLLVMWMSLESWEIPYCRTTGRKKLLLEDGFSTRTRIVFNTIIREFEKHERNGIESISFWNGGQDGGGSWEICQSFYNKIQGEPVAIIMLNPEIASY